MCTLWGSVQVAGVFIEQSELIDKVVKVFKINSSPFKGEAHGK
jgi:hypothetical protein